MKPEEIQRRAAETILERGVRVPIPAPRFLLLFGKKEIGIILHEPYLRTIQTAAALSLKDGFSIDELATGNTDAAMKLVLDHSETVARIVAVHFLNGKWKNRLFSKILGSWFLSRLTNRRILDIALIIVMISRYQDFTTTIRLFKEMSMTIMIPKNLSPKEKGSQEAEQ